MSTIVVARKGKQACIAADSLTTFGDIRLSHDLDKNPNKIQTFGKTHMGIVGAAAHTLVAERAFRDPAAKVDFSTRDSTFDSLLRLHPVLKEKYFLNPKDSDGIFAMFALREVYEYARFWAVGSGACYALGAMHAVYNKAKSAREIAKAGALAGAEFDTSSAPPLTFKTVTLS